MDNFRQAARQLALDAMGVESVDPQWEATTLTPALDALGDFGNEVGNNLAIDFLKHAITGELGNTELKLKWDIGPLAQEPSGLDYPEFTISELADLYAFAAFVSESC